MIMHPDEEDFANLIAACHNSRFFAGFSAKPSGGHWVPRGPSRRPHGPSPICSCNPSFPSLPRQFTWVPIQGFSSCPACCSLVHLGILFLPCGTPESRPPDATRRDGEPGIPNLREFGPGRPVLFVESGRVCDVSRGNNESAVTASCGC
jgi:hypothetical protein